jgi:hypothetical protein
VDVSLPPQPHVSPGYTPIAPVKPHFDVSGSLPAIEAAGKFTDTGTASDVPHLKPAVSPYLGPASGRVSQTGNKAPVQSPVKKRRFLRRFATFVIFIGIFTGILYGTASYMRGRGILPTIRNPFKAQTAVANTDIYLRPSPSTDNDPVGLVTKNSKVKIVNSQNNWYQVDVIEQGRVRPGQPAVSRGWLNGKYIDLDNN